jgi:hypothetical protein
MNPCCPQTHNPASASQILWFQVFIIIATSTLKIWLVKDKYSYYCGASMQIWLIQKRRKDVYHVYQYHVYRYLDISIDLSLSIYIYIYAKITLKNFILSNLLHLHNSFLGYFFMPSVKLFSISFKRDKHRQCKQSISTLLALFSLPAILLWLVNIWN